MLQRYAAATYVGRMCPGACAQETLLMQCYNRCEDKMEDKAFKDISNTQNVGLGRGGSIYIYFIIYIYSVHVCGDGAPRGAGLLSLLQIVLYVWWGRVFGGGFWGGWGVVITFLRLRFPDVATLQVTSKMLKAPHFHRRRSHACVFVYVNVYVHVYMYMYMYMHMYMHMYMYMYMYTYIIIYAHAYAYVYVYVMYTYICIYVCVYICVCIYDICIILCMCLCVCMYSYVYMYSYVHM